MAVSYVEQDLQDSERELASNLVASEILTVEEEVMGNLHSNYPYGRVETEEMKVHWHVPRGFQRTVVKKHQH